MPLTPESASRRRLAAVRLLVEVVGFAVVLFVTRFVARPYLLAQLEGDECHAGGIAVDWLAHGFRFPFLVYGQTEYDNASFFGGILAAGAFSLLGRNLLALKLVPLLFSTASAVATLRLLRGCLEELGLTSRRVRWVATAVLVIAIALAPLTVTFCSALEIFSHSSSAAVNTLLLALFSCHVRTRSAMGAAGRWALVGLALFLTKGTILIVPVLAVVEIVLARRSPRQLAAACGGFFLGALPELLMVVQRHGIGWAVLIFRTEENSRKFPQAFLTDLWTLSENRVELLAVWTLAIAAGVAMLIRSLRRRSGTQLSRGNALATGGSPPVTLALVVGVTLLHLAMLAVMAQGGLADAYASYGYPTLVVLLAVLVASICAQAAVRWGEAGGTWISIAAIAVTLVLFRLDTATWELATLRSLWRDRPSAACSWRLAEGFGREYRAGLAPPGRSLEQHVIERCRSLAEEDQVLNCIGGIARVLLHRGGMVAEAQVAELSESERRAYAYYSGIHMGGDTSPCEHFTSADLRAECVGAVRLDCLAFADSYMRLVAAQNIGRPRCNLHEPPMNGYWSVLRADLLERPAGNPPSAAVRALMKGCTSVVDECY